MDIPDITDVVLTAIVNRLVRFVPHKVLYSLSDVVNEAGRTGRSCAGNVWHVGRFLSLRPTIPTSFAHGREVTVVWGTNSRISFARETSTHFRFNLYVEQIEKICHLWIFGTNFAC